MDEKHLARIMRGVALPPWMDLFERHYFFFDREKTPWYFSESLRNGNYNRYTLQGSVISGSAFHGESGSAVLFARLSFHPFEGKTIVYIEDITTNKRSRHIGSWMINKFILFLRDWDRVLCVEKVWGELSSVDEEDEENALRRDVFWKKFGFMMERHGGQKKIWAEPSFLKQRPLKDVREVSVEGVLRECFRST